MMQEKSLAGLAARYPGDQGITRDRAVLFAEDFETGTIADVSRRWTEASNKGNKVLTLSDEHPDTGAGRRSLQMTATLGENTGGHLYLKLPREEDTVYARFYVRFAPDADYIHHFVTLGGYRPATNWPQGGAGEKPRGDDRVTVGIEPVGDYGKYPAPGVWNFYAYWHEMKISADKRYWGQSLKPRDTPLLVPRGRWQCVEMMLKMNTAPEKADGELALWLDGKPTMHIGQGIRRGPWTGLGFNLLPPNAPDGEPFEGFRWRTSRDLKINYFLLMHYVTELPARQNRVANPKRENTVWFDDIVIATEYIGPTFPLR